MQLYAGNYDDYRMQRERAEEQREKERESKPVKSTPPARRSRGLTYAERLELEGLMDRIEQAEAVVSGIEGELADPGLYATRGSEVPGLHAKLAQARSQADALTSRWEQLELKREEGERKI